MIQKKYRLSEREVKKVLAKGKPFFSYSIVFNRIPNKLPYSRFAIVIGGKSVPNNVIRNLYRRSYYNLCGSYIFSDFGDIVCVVKKQTKLQNDESMLRKILSEMNYLFEKKLGKNT